MKERPGSGDAPGVTAGSTVLVLGAAGAIGAHTVRACLAAGLRVRALLRPSSSAANLAGLDVEIVTGDIRNAAELTRAFNGCDAFVHAAGFYPVDPFRRRRAIAEGLASVTGVFDAARAAGVARGVYVSSLSTIPRGRAVPQPSGRTVAIASEGAGDGRDARVGPLGDAARKRQPHAAAPPRGSAYVLAKRAMEEAAFRAAAEGLPLVIVNPPLCLGELDRKPTSGQLVLQVGRGRMPFFLDGPVNVVYTGDVGRGIAAALRRGRPSERYILGGTNTTYGWLFRQIAFESGVRPPVIRMPLRVARAGAWGLDGAARLIGRPAFAAIGVDLVSRGQHFDTAKAARELGLVHPTPAVETVRRAVRWFRDQGRL